LHNKHLSKSDIIELVNAQSKGLMRCTICDECILTKGAMRR